MMVFSMLMKDAENKLDSEITGPCDSPPILEEASSPNPDDPTPRVSSNAVEVAELDSIESTPTESPGETKSLQSDLDLVPAPQHSCSIP